MIRTTNRQIRSNRHDAVTTVVRVFLLIVLLVCQHAPCQAGEAEVEASLAALKSQAEIIHQRTLTLMGDLDKAWNDFKQDSSPTNEGRINKLKDDFEKTNILSQENWKWIHDLSNERSTTVNFIRVLLNETKNTLDSAAEVARGIIPGATYILGISQETLYNDRWKDTEAAYSALREKGQELRKRHEEIKANMRDKLTDTPENRDELQKLEEEIAIWKSKIQTMSEIYEFLRSDMPAEVVFWHELTGPYVEALYDNVKNNLEEIILWDTLGGTSPAERLYKLFKPALQLKLGDTFFSDPVLTEKIRNTLVMDVLFGGASLDRIQKGVELGVGKILDSDSVQKAAAELLGNPTRRAELQRMLQQMSYDRIPAKAQAALTKLGEKVPSPGSGTVERFVASGLSADEINRLKKIKDSKAVADGIMKVANEFIGPALNWSSFSQAYATTKEECAIYRTAYKQLRAAKLVGAGTFTGVGGTVATSAEDNFVNVCFDDPSVFASYLEKLKETYKGVNVEQFAIKETFRKKKIEPVNDQPVTGDSESEGESYSSLGEKSAQLFSDLWENAVAPESVMSLAKVYSDGLSKIYSENLSRLLSLQPRSCYDYVDGRGLAKDCPPEIKAAIDREKETYGAERGKFGHPYNAKVQEEMPPLAKKLAEVIKTAKIDKSSLIFRDDKVIDLYLEKEGINVMLGADEANKQLWWGGFSGKNRPEDVQAFLKGFLAESQPHLDNAAAAFTTLNNNMNKAITGISRFLAAKKLEKNAIMDLGMTLEQVADRLGERRNFFIVAQSSGWTLATATEGKWTPEMTAEWNAGHFNVDEFIARHGSFTTVFSRLFDAEMARFEEVLERLMEHRSKVQQAASAAATIPALLQRLDAYAAQIEKLSQGRYEVQKVTSTVISPVFSLGISTTQEGGIWLELLADELKPEKISTPQQLNFLLSSTADHTFPDFFGIRQISHPMLRTFVTPDQSRLDKARSILRPAYQEVEALLNTYTQAERTAADIRKDIDRQMTMFRGGVRAVAPGLADSLNWQTLEGRKRVAGYDDWLSLLKPVSDYPRLPDSLWKDLFAQEKGLTAYRSFLRSIRLTPPVIVDQEVKEVLIKLEAIYAKVERDGSSWLDYDPLRFSTSMNDLKSTAHKIYTEMLNKGKAYKDSPVANAYLKIVSATSKISTARIERDNIASVVQTLTLHLKETGDFLGNYESNKDSVSQEDIRFRVAMLEEDIQIGSLADTLRSTNAVSTLIDEINSQLARLKGLKVAGNERINQRIRDFYQLFREAYEARDDSRIMSYMGDEWEAGDGTTLSDMQVNLSRMFRKFDEMKMDIQNMQINPVPHGFMVTYDVIISSRIYKKNLRHQEKSAVIEHVSFGDNESPRISKTLNGRYWFIE